MPNDIGGADLPVVENGISAIPYTVVKILGFEDASPQSPSSGTGFFFQFILNGVPVLCIITNKHVVAGLDVLEFHYGLSTGEGKRAFGPAEIVRIRVDSYPILNHPDDNVDIVAIPAQPMIFEIAKKGKRPYILSFGQENFPPDWLIDKLVASTDLIMAGFPNGLMDQANNLPLVRKGILSTPYGADYNGAPNFVVDIAAFGGSSGSPILALFNGIVPAKHGWTIGSASTYLLGLLHSGPVISNIGEIVSEPVPTGRQFARSNLMIHLGYCAKISLLNDFIPLITKIVEKERQSSGGNAVP